MSTPEQIASEIIKGYETNSGVVMGIAWIHRPALTSLLALAAQQGMQQRADLEGK